MRRLAIVYPRANLDTVPSLVGAAEMLAEGGYEVDVFCYSSAAHPPPTFASPRVRVRSLGVEDVADRATAGLRSAARRADWLPRSARTRLAQGYATLGASLAHGSRLMARVRTRRLARAGAYACLIGVDPDGLLLAQAMAGGAPVGYYSLELLLSSELTGEADARLKEQERRASREAAFVIVQDHERARLLAEDNGLAWERMVLVPNSPTGPARRLPSRAWPRRLGVAQDRRIVLHAGSLGDWTGIEALVASAPNWPEPWVLVVHTRYDAQSSAYVQRLRASADPTRVFFSLRPVDRQTYQDLVDGADVGLAFYVASGGSAFTGRNIQAIGLSSGKLAYYLRAGLPVVVNRAASIGAALEEAGCGLAVLDAAAIGPALSRISADYARFSEAACRFFDQNLEFRRAFSAAIDRIDSLAAHA
ncbi:MAG: hypothetical protein M3336_07395 [Chloroflexota bacterium]|nr:hypothetical protein [Chloroflexota bacterium]